MARSGKRNPRGTARNPRSGGKRSRGGTSGGGGSSIVATGGVETTSGGYKYHTFIASGTLVVTAGGTAEALIVAGGGGGGAISLGAGGGAGGVVIGAPTLAVASYAVTVGAGGAGATVVGTNNATNGGDSSVAGLGLATAVGGGRGGGGDTQTGLPNSGGSGGGGKPTGGTYAGGAGTAGQGNAGGAGNVGGANAGGGGGAGAVGGTGSTPNGGVGVEWPTGSGTYYAGGGGGANGAGGNGGGGAGGPQNVNGVNGTANKGGGGGGGGSWSSNSTLGGAGGAGVVVFRYPFTPPAPATATGGTTVVSAGYKYHTFTADSTLTVLTPGALEYLIVGGGGGGGGGVTSGGGGGGGRVQSGIFAAMTAGAFPITVGAGGAAGTAGGNSTFNGVTSQGGGRGAGTTGAAQSGGNGGGGSSVNTSGAAGGTGCTAGGSGFTSQGGGGGGAGAVGGNASAGNCGNGGVGTQWPTTTGEFYGAGGCGGSDGGVPIAPSGGGTGGSSAGAGGNGATNRGGGGGGCGNLSGPGGVGGSGIVIVRYTTAEADTTYGGLIASQGGTGYWPFQNARSDTHVEPDQIGAFPLNMTSGSVPTLGAGAGPLAQTNDTGLTFAAADTEDMDSAGGAGGQISTQQNWSWSCWIKSPSMSGNGPVLAYFRTGTNQYQMFMHRDDQSGLTMQMASGAGAMFLNAISGSLGDGAWHHVAFTRAYSANNSLDIWKIYIDGVERASNNSAALGITANSTGTTANFSFAGRWDTHGNQYDGNMAHVAMAVGVTWSAAQITAQWARRTATGGAVTIFGGYKYHTFIANGTFDPVALSPLAVDYIVVGGGGGAGGYHRGGGGGGGQVIVGSTTISASQAITVGAGGTNGNTGALAGSAGSQGGTSSLGAIASAVGGGRGGGGDNSYTPTTGGSGGGGSGHATGTPHAGATAGTALANAGGQGAHADQAGGGGGGAGGAGLAGSASSVGGAGYTWVDGVAYGPGGGGGRFTGTGAGGAGGGGTGGTDNGNGVIGTANRGAGGGGGGNYNTSPTAGSAGTAGVVILRYPAVPTFLEATGGTVTTDGYRNYHTFVNDGTFVRNGVTNVDLFALGGGGAGGGGSAGTSYDSGGAGGVVRESDDIAIAADAAVTVGVGGTYANVSNNGTVGGNGGSTIIGALLTATGGEGGGVDGLREGGDNADFNGVLGSAAGANNSGAGAGSGGDGIYAAFATTGGIGKLVAMLGDRRGGGGAGGGGNGASNAGGDGGGGGYGAGGTNAYGGGGSHAGTAGGGKGLAIIAYPKAVTPTIAAGPPTYVGAGNNVSAAGPIDKPGGLAVGDLLLIHACGSAAAAQPTSGDFRLLIGRYYDVTCIYYKVIDGTEPATWTPATLGIGTHTAYRTAAFRGVNARHILDGGVIVGGPQANPGMTTTRANTLVICTNSILSFSGGAVTGVTNGFTPGPFATNVGSCSYGFAYKLVASPGAVGSTNFPSSHGSSGTMMFGLRTN